MSHTFFTIEERLGFIFTHSGWWHKGFVFFRKSKGGLYEVKTITEYSEKSIYTADLEGCLKYLSPLL